MKLHEDYEISCRFLTELIVAEQLKEGGPLRSRLLLEDFATKAAQIRSTIALSLGYQILLAYAPLDVRKAMEHLKTVDQPQRPAADVLIVTIIEEELRAAKAAFGIKHELEDHNINGLRVWESEIRKAQDGGPVKVFVTMVGGPRNVECAVACSQLFQRWQFGLAVLVGIAAGLETKTRVGDVVRAELVLDYEGARAEVDGLRKRPVAYPLEVAIGRDVAHFVAERAGWYVELENVLNTLELTAVQKSAVVGWRPSVHEGVVLAGEKLLANNPLPGMQLEYHERVRAGEMEGSGFARACREYGTPWLVFRGVSDYGTADKSQYEPWKLLASASAATAALAFIKKDYRRPWVRF